MKLLLFTLLLLTPGVFAEYEESPPPRCIEDPDVEPLLNADVSDDFSASKLGAGEVPVFPLWFHVMNPGNVNLVPRENIEEQVRVLNASFGGVVGGVDVGFRFRLAGVSMYANKENYHLKCGSRPVEAAMKEATAKDPALYVNVWLCKPGALGYAYFPTSFPESSFMNGVVLHYKTLPAVEGSKLVPYEYFGLGYTLAHELGHYFGLFHTFQNGCGRTGDRVDDTPKEAYSYSGGDCDLKRDSCPEAPGIDPINNYMDYSQDACLNTFTKGQRQRMRQITAKYKKSLMAHSLGGVPVEEDVTCGYYCTAATGPVRCRNLKACKCKWRWRNKSRGKGECIPVNY